LIGAQLGEPVGLPAKHLVVHRFASLPSEDQLGGNDDITAAACSAKGTLG